jgi:hypothetical protein
VADLPSPVTVNDLLVRAVHDRLEEQTVLLRGILDRLPAAAPVPAERPAGEVELLEPSAPGKARPAQQPRKATSHKSKEG